MPAVEPVLTVRTAHPFGNLDLPAIRPVAETLAWLRARPGFGLKPLGDRLMLWRDPEMADPLQSPVTLRFNLAAVSGAFAMVTDLTGLAALPAPIFTNVGDQADLLLTTRRDEVAETLVSPRNDGPVTWTLAGKPDPAATLADLVAVSAAGAVAVTGFDPVTRQVSMTGQGLRVGIPIILTYPAKSVVAADALAEIAITLDQSLIDARAAAGHPTEYVVRFAVSALRWCFYVVTAADTAAEAVGITVPPGVEARGLAFSSVDAKRDLTGSPDPADLTGQSLLARVPPPSARAGGQRVVRFLSDQPIAFDPAPIARIGLVIAGNRRFENCPNPAPEAAGALRRADGTLSAFIHTTILAA